jgi:hypothetical protein
MHLRLTLTVMLCALPRVASADHVKVAVVPGIAVNLDAARVDVLSQDLAQALSTELEVDAVGGLEVRRLLPTAGLPADCVANQACVSDVARRLAAQQLLFVVMVDTGSGGAIQVDSTWVDPATHASAPRPAIDILTVADAGWLVALGGTITAAVLYGTSGEASHVIVEPTPGGVAVAAVGSF